MNTNSQKYLKNVEITAFWDTSPCSLLEADRRFRGAYCLHHEGDLPDNGSIVHLWNVG
jgi:hypothetical protein